MICVKKVWRQRPDLNREFPEELVFKTSAIFPKATNCKLFRIMRRWHVSAKSRPKRESRFEYARPTQ